ncbi:hypothetical protein DM02DRAFT_631675 [Periconia macrospinosa]|uniref:Uncharacterized protein n=1 Tax=Periconia macrospinosa TaxID=97972 RepID=A0A2V1DF80_9PLEO|nr:hypothetical protein DM02DRAFT_631675 [Periconia macrospinosa]
MQKPSTPPEQGHGQPRHHALPLEYEPEADLDPLVAHAAARIAYALNDLKRGLDERDGDSPASANLKGAFQLLSGSQHFDITIATSDEREDAPVTVDARLRRRDVSKTRTAAQDRTTAHTSSSTSSSAIEGDHDGARKRKRLDHDTDPSQPDRNVNSTQNNHVALPIVPDEELLALITKLRNSTNPESIEGLRSLIHGLHKTWQAEQRSNPQFNPSSLSSAAARVQQQQDPQPSTTTSFPRPSADVPTNTSTPSNPASPSSPETVPELLKQQRELLSKQIQWVEECRRVASSLSDQRTETWRTTSAAFHDTNRVDRERFQHRILSESGVHAHLLNQILAEVRAIGLHAQSMKWETPASFGGPPPTVVGGGPSPVVYAAPFPPARIAPMFPTASGPPSSSAPTAARGEGQVRRTSSSVQQNGRESSRGTQNGA